jgi:hypothetical protein
MKGRVCLAPLATFALFFWSASAQTNPVVKKGQGHASSGPRSARVSIPIAPVQTAQAHTPPSPNNCDDLEQRTKLQAAEFQLDNLHPGNASDQFLGLVTSCNDGVKAAAVSGFQRANVMQGTWWWLEGRYLPPLRWYHHPSFKQGLRRTLGLVAIFIALSLITFYLTDLLAFVSEFLAAVSRRHRQRTFTILGRLPRASIMTPSELVSDTQTKLFASMLESACVEVSRVLERAGGGLQVRSTALLALPLETTSQLVESMPKVKGVDVAGIVKFVFFLKRYAGWRVESEIGFCPATKNSSGVESPPRLVAYASLRHAFWLRGGPWPVQRMVRHSYDVDGVAFAIAARIMGYNMRGKRA